MKIGLNATCFNDRPSGAKQRFIGIYGELIKLMPEAEFVIFEPADCRVAGWFDGLSNISAIETPIPSEGRLRKFVAGIRYWSNAFSHDSFDLFEGFNLPLITAPTKRTLLTIHDIRRMYPKFGAIERAIYRVAIERSLKAADHVVTVSESMKKEILDFFPHTSVSVIYNGLDSSAFNSVTKLNLAAFRQKYKLPEDYVLTVGHFETRKNFLRLIDAVAMLRDRDVACPLLIIGNDSGERKAVEARIAAANLTDSVKILSGLTDVEVRCAYKQCHLFVFPSAYEGFGIPILEAMAAQRPMVLSDLPVFREITLNNGIYFPHDDIEAMANAIELGLSSSNERTRLVEFGSKRVKNFNFPHLAAQMEAIYRAMEL